MDTRDEDSQRQAENDIIEIEPIEDYNVHKVGIDGRPLLLFEVACTYNLGVLGILGSNNLVLLAFMGGFWLHISCFTHLYPPKMKGEKKYTSCLALYNVGL